MSVTTERAFRDLKHQLRVLDEALELLSTTAEEDKPTRDDVVVAGRLADAVLAARGLLDEARGHGEEALRAVAAPLDGDRARRGLAACQERFHGFARQVAVELASFDRLDDLRTVGEERGPAWRKWAEVVHQSLEQCQGQIDEARNAMLVCWQELAERLGAGAVSVRNTSIGQQIMVPNDECARSRQPARTRVAAERSVAK
jgi:hypothetical protein